MILPKIGRTNMLKGVSALSVLALVTIGMAGIGSFEDEPEAMRGKSDADLEALMDPLAEELALDHSRRALAEYRASKGLFGCEGDCIDNKHRWLEAERDLLSAGQMRAAARKAARARDRAASNGVTISAPSGGGSTTTAAVPSLADRQAAAKARQAARAAKRRGIPVIAVNKVAPSPAVPGIPPAPTPPAPSTPFMSPRAAAQARAAERKRQRDAEKAARIAASGGGGGSSATGGGGSSTGVSGPAPVRMTGAQRQAARKAERLAAANAVKVAAAAAAAAAAAEAAKPCEEKFGTCAAIQSCHHLKFPEDTSLATKTMNWDILTPTSVRQDLLAAELSLAVETTKLAEFKEDLPRDERNYALYIDPATTWDMSDLCCIGCCPDPLEILETKKWQIQQSEGKIATAQNTLSQCLEGFGSPPTLTVAQQCKVEVDFDTAAAAKRASMSDSELLSFQQYVPGAGAVGWDSLAKLAEAKEREMNPNECTDFVRIQNMNDQLAPGTGELVLIDHFDAHLNSAATRYELRLQAAKLQRCIAVGLFKELRDRQMAGEVLTTVVQSARDDMDAARATYDSIVAAEGGICALAFSVVSQNHEGDDHDHHDEPPAPAPAPAPAHSPTAQINQICQEPLPDFHEELARLVSTYNEQELIQMYGVPYVWPLAHSVQMMDQPWSNYAIAGDHLANERYAEPSSCVDINRHDMMMEQAHDGGEFYFIQDYAMNDGSIASLLSEGIATAKLTKCITSKLYDQTPTTATQAAMEQAVSDYNMQVQSIKDQNVCPTSWYTSDWGCKAEKEATGTNVYWCETPAPTVAPAPAHLTTAQINQICQEPLPDFHEELNRMVTTMSFEEITELVPFLWAPNMPYSLQMMDDPWGSYTKAGSYISGQRNAEPSSCVDIVRAKLEAEPIAYDAFDFHFIKDFVINDGSIAQHASESIGSAKLTKCITTKLHDQTPTAATQAAMDQAVSAYETTVQSIRDQNICVDSWYASDWGCQEENFNLFSCVTPMPTATPDNPVPAPSPVSSPTEQLHSECQVPEPDFNTAAMNKLSSMTYGQLLPFATMELTYADGLPAELQGRDRPFTGLDLAKVAVVVDRYENPSSCTDIVRGQNMLMSATTEGDIYEGYNFFFVGGVDVSASDLLVRYEGRLQGAKETKCVQDKLYELSPTTANLAAKTEASTNYETIVGGGKNNPFCHDAYFKGRRPFNPVDNNYLEQHNANEEQGSV